MKSRRLKNSDPYNRGPRNAPAQPDPWKGEPVKKDRSRDSTRTSTDASVRSPTRTSTSTKADTRGNVTVTGGAGNGNTTVNLRRNPITQKPPITRAFVIMAQRGTSGKAPLMWFDGKKFTNNDAPRIFGAHDRARGMAQQLVTRYPALHGFRVWVERPSHALLNKRRKNPESPGLEEAARRLEDFSGHAAKKVIKVTARSTAREGLVIGELDLIGYRTKRDGIGGGKLLRYAHDFSKGSRPLLAVSKDGKQLHIVGGQYEFTDAGIEDR